MEKYDIFISDTVLEEIEKAPDDKKGRLLQTIQKHSPAVFELDKDANIMAEAYISNGLLNIKHLPDINHIAIATVNRMDILISWNMRHMVNIKTKNIVNGTNRLHGYSEMTICTPEEMVEHED